MYAHSVNKPAQQNCMDAVLCVSRTRRRYLLLVHIKNDVKIVRPSWLNHTPNNLLYTNTVNTR